MELLNAIYDFIRPVLPMSTTVVGVLLVIYAVKLIAEKRYATVPGLRFRMQVVLIILSLLGFLAVVVALPVSDSTQGQLLSLIGIVLSAAIALSSTTLLGNALAGFMLRATRSFRPGDFIRIGDHFGRISEQELFHVEIQTEDRDLTTLPNLYLVTHPYKVIRTSGTMITAEVSLGYDVPESQVRRCLLVAAEAAGLADPYVHIMALQDFSVLYRIGGLLTEVKHVLSARSRLHEEMLRALHDHGIEIVSPTYMNTRALSPDRRVIPDADDQRFAEPRQIEPESIVFDKADEAESIERLREMHDKAGSEIDSLKRELKQMDDEATCIAIELRIEALSHRRERLTALIQRKEDSEG